MCWLSYHLLERDACVPAASGSDSESEGKLVWQRAAAAHAPVTVLSSSDDGDPGAGPSGSGSKRWPAGAGPFGEPDGRPGPSVEQPAGDETLQAAPAQPAWAADGGAGAAPLSAQPRQAEAPGEWVAGSGAAGAGGSGSSRRLSLPEPEPAKPPPAVAPAAESLPAEPAPAAKPASPRGSMPEPARQPPAAMVSDPQGAPSGAADAQLAPLEVGKQLSPPRFGQLQPGSVPVLAAPAGSPVLEALGDLAAQHDADSGAGKAGSGAQAARRTPASFGELDSSNAGKLGAAPAGVKEELEVQWGACSPEAAPAQAPHGAPAQLPARPPQSGGAAQDAQPVSPAQDGALPAAGLQEAVLAAAERAETAPDATPAAEASAERRATKQAAGAAVQHGRLGAAQEAAPPAAPAQGAQTTAAPASAPAAPDAGPPPAPALARASAPAAAPQQRPIRAASNDDHLLEMIEEEQRMAEEAEADAAERLEAEAAAALDAPASGVWQQGLDVGAELATLDVETRVRGHPSLLSAEACGLPGLAAALRAGSAGHPCSQCPCQQPGMWWPGLTPHRARRGWRRSSGARRWAPTPRAARCTASARRCWPCLGCPTWWRRRRQRRSAPGWTRPAWWTAWSPTTTTSSSSAGATCSGAPRGRAAARQRGAAAERQRLLCYWKIYPMWLCASAGCLIRCLLRGRHLFAEKQYVEEFRTDDITRELGLDQKALIRLGMLLGSDYTEGVAGIGIVNAVEVF